MISVMFNIRSNARRLGLLVATWMLAGPLWGADPLLKSGDRLVFLGDSITQAGAAPGGYITRFQDLVGKTHPDLKLEVVGAGVSGNRVPDLEKRLDLAVLAKKPAVVVIYIGINDVWHSQMGRGTPKDEFQAGLERLVDALKQAGSRVVLCTPSVIGEKRKGANPLDEQLDQYSGLARAVAKAAELPVIDLRTAFQSHLDQHNPQNAEQGVLTTDGVHLNDAGNQFVAERMAAGLGLAPVETRLLRHVVLFKFKSDCSAEQVQEVVDAFRLLPARIDSAPRSPSMSRHMTSGDEEMDRETAESTTIAALVFMASDAERLPVFLAITGR